MKANAQNSTFASPATKAKTSACKRAIFFNPQIFKL